MCEHRKLTLEKKLPPLLLPGMEPTILPSDHEPHYDHLHPNSNIAGFGTDLTDLGTSLKSPRLAVEISHGDGNLNGVCIRKTVTQIQNSK